MYCKDVLRLFWLLGVCLLIAASNASADNSNSNTDEPLPVYSPANHYYRLQQKITYGNATLAEVREALSGTDDVAALTNTIHALYSMRWHRGVQTLLDDLWLKHSNKYPELAWEHLEKVPVRIAIASTITRIRIFDTDEYKDYIRGHKYDDHEFHRAQVVISLALNSDPADVPYIREMAETDNVYVSQSAITSLAIMGNPQAMQALKDLALKYTGKERGDFIRQVLLKAYPER